MLSKLFLFSASKTEDASIFEWIEKKMNISIPVYIKHILTYCGYDNCYSIATIVDEDIKYFTDEATKGSFCLDKICIAEGSATSANAYTNIMFSRGHIKLLQAIVRVVKETLECDGADSFTIKVHPIATKVPAKVSTIQNENSTTDLTSFRRKRFKFSAVAAVSTSNEVRMNDTVTTEACARSTLTRKAMKVLVTHTPKLLANVSINLQFQFC